MDISVIVFLNKISGFFILFLLFIIIRKLLAPKKSLTDFFIGDSGTYSLSRLQIVAWVYIIISQQISLLISIMQTNYSATHLYDLVLPEEILFLIGLSSAGYLAVKKITVDEIQKTRNAKISIRNWSDLISTNNSLDFSKFQFLIWTLFAVFLYVLHFNEYINLVIEAKNGKDIAALLNVDYSGIPTISWSFVVLMGLSQGAYVGKKLIPEFKVEEFKEKRAIELEEQIELMGLSIKEKSDILKFAKPGTKVGQMQILGLETEITELQKKQKLLIQEKNRAKKV